MRQNQQIYFSLGSTYPIPHEFETDTMQVPRGQYSVLSDVADNTHTTYKEDSETEHGNAYQSIISTKRCILLYCAILKPP